MGALVFPIEQALFLITDDGLFCCRIFAGDGPSSGPIRKTCFCFMPYPLPSADVVVGKAQEIPGRRSERNSLDDPSSHVYAGATLEVQALSEGSIEAWGPSPWRIPSSAEVLDILLPLLG